MLGLPKLQRWIWGWKILQAWKAGMQFPLIQDIILYPSVLPGTATAGGAEDDDGCFLPQKTRIQPFSLENPAVKEHPSFPAIPVSPAKPGVLIGFFQNFIFPDHDIISSLLSADGSNKCFLFFLGIQSRDGLRPWQELKFMAFRDIYFHFQGKAELRKHFSSRFSFTPCAAFPCRRNYETSAPRAKGKRGKKKFPVFSGGNVYN